LLSIDAECNKNNKYLSNKEKMAVVNAPATTRKQAMVKALVAIVKTDFVTIVKTKYGCYRYCHYIVVGHFAKN